MRHNYSSNVMMIFLREILANLTNIWLWRLKHSHLDFLDSLGLKFNQVSEVAFRLYHWTWCHTFVSVNTSSFELVGETTAWPHKISGQVLSSHSIISSSRTVSPCSPWGGRWIGHLRTRWSTVCSSAPHSQSAEEAIPHLYKQERERPTPVWRRLSRTQALLGRVIPAVVCQFRG